jgi:hypothetical protein
MKALFSVADDPFSVSHGTEGGSSAPRQRRKQTKKGPASRRAFLVLVMTPYDIACFTRSGENGTRRMRTPVASKIALAIAADSGRIDGSPAPVGGSSG